MFGNRPIPDEILQTFDWQEQQAVQNEYQYVARLAAGDCGLDELLGQFLSHAVRLFGASAGAIWLRAPGQAKPAIRVERSGQVCWGDMKPQREVLVRHAFARTRAFLVETGGTPDCRTSARNPFDGYLLLGPIDSQGDRVGAFELLLGTQSPRQVGNCPPHAIIDWLDYLSAGLRREIEQRFLGNLAPLQPALVNLAATQAEIEGYKRAIAVSLEVTLDSYAGANFGSLSNNRTFTKKVQELLDANGLRVACPECGSPAILRCQPAGNAKSGVFLYDHYLEGGRTFHGGPTTFPKLRLVSKPPRRTSPQEGLLRRAADN